MVDGWILLQCRGSLGVWVELVGGCQGLFIIRDERYLGRGVQRPIPRCNEEGCSNNGIRVSYPLPF